jgi:hypothetical protein
MVLFNRGGRYICKRGVMERLKELQVFSSAIRERLYQYTMSAANTVEDPNMADVVCK